MIGYIMDNQDQNIFAKLIFSIIFIDKNDKDMELRQLKYFKEACELQNFSEKEKG